MAGGVLCFPARPKKMDVLLTPGLADIQQGQGSLREQWAGSAVTFRGQSVRVLINRNPTTNWGDGEKRNGKANVEFLPKDYNAITLFKDEIDSDPAVGEKFLENNESTYRIQELQEFELHWVCLCKEASLP